ncbi:MAG: DotH/IcmK family type IV secretion protein [Acidiferrobacteraceae bacterium]
MRLSFPVMLAAAAALLVPLPATAGSPATGVSNTEFQRSLKTLLPLSPNQIKAFKHRADRTRRAIHEGPQPILQSSSQILDLAPGAALPVITVAPDYVSSVVFVDDTGAPWPITRYAVGAPSWFSVSQPKIASANMLTVSPTGTYVSSDLVVTLKDYATPVMWDLKTSRQHAAALIALRANLPGPNATPADFAAATRPTANRTGRAQI